MLSAVLGEAFHYNNKVLPWQGEDKDSSDEEWDAAFAALDPVAQIGWANPSGRAPELGANLVRDVFVASDVMHVTAMSSVDANSEMEGVDYEEGGDAAGVDSAPARTEGTTVAEDSMDDESEG